MYITCKTLIFALFRGKRRRKYIVNHFIHKGSLHSKCLSPTNPVPLFPQIYSNLKLVSSSSSSPYCIPMDLHTGMLRRLFMLIRLLKIQNPCTGMYARCYGNVPLNAIMYNVLYKTDLHIVDQIALFVLKWNMVLTSWMGTFWTYMHICTCTPVHQWQRGGRQILLKMSRNKKMGSNFSYTYMYMYM